MNEESPAFRRESVNGTLSTEPHAAIPWWLPLTLGVLSVALGVVALVWPGLTLYVFAVLIGAWLLALGISRVIGAFVRDPSRTTGQHVLSGVTGVLYVVGGVICLRHIVVSLAIIAAFVALQWLLTGVADIAMAAHEHASHRGWLIVAGVLSLLLGVVFLSLPALSLSYFVVFTAITALVVGVMQAGVAMRLRAVERG
jgi:uncharacterized membrane protein HdeD (DUF308 family)